MHEQLSTGSPLSETWHADTSFVIQQFHKTRLLLKSKDWYLTQSETKVDTWVSVRLHIDSLSINK